MACDLDCMVWEIKTYYYDIMETRFENGEQKHTDLIEEMTAVYPMTVPGEAIVLFEIMATIGAVRDDIGILDVSLGHGAGHFNATLDVTEKTRLAPLAT